MTIYSKVMEKAPIEFEIAYKFHKLPMQAQLHLLTSLTAAFIETYVRKDRKENFTTEFLENIEVLLKKGSELDTEKYIRVKCQTCDREVPIPKEEENEVVVCPICLMGDDDFDDFATAGSPSRETH